MKLKSVSGSKMAGSSHQRRAMDPISTTLGTGITGITPEQGMHDPGTAVNREKVPPGMLRSLLTFRGGRRESCRVEACTARKLWAISNGIRAHFLAVSKVGCPGSATQAAVMGSMAETIFLSTHKGTGL